MTRSERLLAWLGPVLFAGLCAWYSVVGSAPWRVGDPTRDTYNLLVEGMLKGRLSLGLAVPPALLAVADPYDPAQRPAGLAPHDVSLYEGRYYLYFGVVPAAVLLLPYRLATGHGLPLGAAVVVLVTIGYAASLRLFLRLRRRFYPEAGGWTVLVSAMVLGGATMLLTLACRHAEYELAIAGGYAFSSLALWFASLALAGERRWRWQLAAASLCWGLAVGSRPTCVIAALGFLVVNCRRNPLAPDKPDRGRVRPTWGRDLAALWLPICGVGLVLALYNQLRFGNPLEFGVSYQLSGAYESKVRHFAASYLGYDAYAMLLAVPQIGRYFPLLSAAALPVARPEGHFGTDAIGGVLPLFPFLAAVLGLVLSKQARAPGPQTRECVATLAMVGWTGLSMLGVLLFFCGAMARYQADFLPSTMLLAGLGALSLSASRRHASGWRRRAGLGLALAMVTALAIVSCLAGLLVGVLTYDAMHRANLPMYQRVAAVVNWPAHAWERLARLPVGALRLSVCPGSGAPGSVEELFTSGGAEAYDRVLLRHGSSSVRLGFSHAGAPDLWSRPLRLEAGRMYVLSLRLGSLLLPPSAPFYQGLAAERRSALLDRLEVDLDGVPVLLCRQHFHHASPGTWVVGGALTAPGLGGTRTLGWQREQEPRLSDWRLRERVLLAAPTPTGSGFRVALGGPSPIIERLGRRRKAGAGSPDDVGYWELAVRDAGLWVSDEAPVTAAEGLRLELYSRGEPGQETWVLAQNGAALSVTKAAADRLDSTATLVVQPVSVQGPGTLPIDQGQLRLRVRFPAATGGREPLLVSGESMRGDILFVEYLPARQLRFGWDSWGSPSAFSEPVVYEPGQPWDIGISARTLDPAYTGRKGPTPLCLSRDGVVLWERTIRCYPSAPEDLCVGYNPIGGTVCGPMFSGSVEALGAP